MSLRPTLLALSAIACLGGPAYAQWGDAAVCKSLVDARRTGLYVAYQNMADVVPVRVNHAPIKFRWNARFFYVPSLEVEKDEGVWHIRTQTRARSLSGADLAYVYRPGYRTRC